MCGIQRERVINPNPVVVPPPRQIERIPEQATEPVIRPREVLAPTQTFQAQPGPSAADLSAEAVKNAAPQSLGGIASRFSIPVGKHGYSKSLRPEQGRLVR